MDIVLGTHALLSKSVQFKNLGLVIVDEEQHFGVSHKERLKQLRSQVHVLTMTATPIPRTLQLSLSGVRDMSIIYTSPPDRRAIRTYVMTFDTITIREALLREHYRRGQSFYVVPRIADLGEIETFLQEQLPELRYVVAHGQLAAAELDRRVNAFYDGRQSPCGASRRYVWAGAAVSNSRACWAFSAARLCLSHHQAPRLIDRGSAETPALAGVVG